MRHAVPWGDNPTDCGGGVDHGRCGGDTGTGLGAVGTHAKDVNGAGITDLASSAAEWVEDDYTPYAGCVDRLSFDDLCGASQSCAEDHCAADKGCVRGCLPDAAGARDPALAGQGGDRPSCYMPPAAA